MKTLAALVLLLSPSVAWGASPFVVPNATIQSGTIDNTAIGATAPNSGTFTTTTTTGDSSVEGLLTSGALATTMEPSGTMKTHAAFHYGNPLAWSLISTSDNAADPHGGDIPIPSLMSIEQSYGGSNINNGRNGLAVFTNLTAPTSATNSYRWYVGVNAFTKAESPDNGTSGTPAGVIEAVTGSVQLDAGATNYFALLGGEFTVSAVTGSSVARKAVLALNEWPVDTVQGSVIDAYIWATAHTGAVGMRNFLDIDDEAGAAPLSSNATFMKFGGTWTIANGIDFGSVTVSGQLLNWAGGTYKISGNGNAALNTVFANGLQLAGAGGLFITGTMATGTASYYACFSAGQELIAKTTPCL